MTTATERPAYAQTFFDRRLSMWGLRDGVEDSPGFIGPVRRWHSFNDAHDTAQKINRENSGRMYGVWL